MAVGSLFLLLAVIVVVLIVITQPLYLAAKSSDLKQKMPQGEDRDNGEYQRIVRAISESVSDFELGKMSEKDYVAQRKLLEDQAFRWMKDQETAAADPSAETAPEREIEQMIHSRRMNRAEQTSGFCPKCGKPVQKSDAFCPSCGEPTRIYL